MVSKASWPMGLCFMPPPPIDEKALCFWPPENKPFYPKATRSAKRLGPWAYVFLALLTKGRKALVITMIRRPSVRSSVRPLTQGGTF